MLFEYDFEILKFIIRLLTCIYVWAHMSHMWLWRTSHESGFCPFYHVGSGGQTQAIRLSSKLLYPLNPLTSMEYVFK